MSMPLSLAGTEELGERPSGGASKYERSQRDRSRRAERNLKIGTVLVLDYQRRRHTVTVESRAYVWEGRPYSSLSAIARAITGMAWSGPRFFALTSAAEQDARHDRRATGHHRLSERNTELKKNP
jgi:hypothetical protein